jgi:hypothetical protein
MEEETISRACKSVITFREALPVLERVAQKISHQAVLDSDLVPGLKSASTTASIVTLSFALLMRA